MRASLRHFTTLPLCAVSLTLGLCAAAIAQNGTTQLMYVSLAQPCRLVDSRLSQGGPGPLTAANGLYIFGTSDSDIEAHSQNGNASGCALPNHLAAISVNLNQLNTTAAGNLRVWATSAGTSGPTAGSTVYNPSASVASPGQVLYNTGYATIPVGMEGEFFLAVSNGQLDLTMNVVGYWLPSSWTSIPVASAAAGGGAIDYGLGNNSLAFGAQAHATGPDGIALGNAALSTGSGALAIGDATQATADIAVAIGDQSRATAVGATALGYQARATATSSVAIGNGVTATGYGAFALGNSASTDSYSGDQTFRNTFVYGDGSAITYATGNYQFVARAKGGFAFYTSADIQGSAQSTGVYLSAGGGSWGTLSDRNAKDDIETIDGRDVLARVVAMPLATWHYKAQDSRYRHMGPMAQDFYAAFGLGETEKGIDTVDADGVALAAIQGLKSELDDTRRALAERDARIGRLETEMARLAASIQHGTSEPSP